SNTIIALVALICCLVAGGGARAQPFDYPAARLATTWANTDAALPHHVVYTDGSVARAALLRLNPAGLGPSYAFGFFCTASQPRGNGPAAPCTEFLLGVAVVYCNSGAGMTFVTAGVPQVVWSANRGSPVRDGATAELTPEGDLVLRSSNGAVVWSAGTKGRSVAGARIGQRRQPGAVRRAQRHGVAVVRPPHERAPRRAVAEARGAAHRQCVDRGLARWQVLPRRPRRWTERLRQRHAAAALLPPRPQRDRTRRLRDVHQRQPHGVRPARCAAAGRHPAAHRGRRHGAVHATGARRPPPDLRVALGLDAGVRRAQVCYELMNPEHHTYIHQGIWQCPRKI
uniref:non-specific serine/threonine protein kinase n=1 Tax=Aegilops tauschii subsp. strangulata TaxID=200361 RepID=A0A453GR70_AEGTS